MYIYGWAFLSNLEFNILKIKVMNKNDDLHRLIGIYSVLL